MIHAYRRETTGVRIVSARAKRNGAHTPNGAKTCKNAAQKLAPISHQEMMICVSRVDHPGVRIVSVKKKRNGAHTPNGVKTCKNAAQKLAKEPIS
jgi:hypothetical protein